MHCTVLVSTGIILAQEPFLSCSTARQGVEELSMANFRIRVFAFQKVKVSNRMRPNCDLKAELGRIILASFWHHKTKRLSTVSDFFAFPRVKG